LEISLYFAKKFHPAEKPLPLIRKIVYETDGDIILDPFKGSATTGVACVNLNRRFIGIEINEKYFDTACKRIESAVSQMENIKRIAFDYGHPPMTERLEDGKRFLNCWRGFKHGPGLSISDCEDKRLIELFDMWQMFIRGVICGRSEEIYDYVCKLKPII
jgi:hypothetical protein